MTTEKIAAAKLLKAERLAEARLQKAEGLAAAKLQLAEAHADARLLKAVDSAETRLRNAEVEAVARLQQALAPADAKLLMAAGLADARLREALAPADAKLLTAEGLADVKLRRAEVDADARLRDVHVELALQRDVFERFFALSLDMMCISSDGYLKRVSPSFEALGYSTEELLSRPFIDFVHPDDVARTLTQLAKLEDGATVIAFEHRFRCKDGTWRWLSWISGPDASGTMYSVARDITDATLAQDSERMASMGTLAAGVAHEINNPLACVMANLDLVLERVEELVSTPEFREIREELQDAREATARIASIVRDLKIFSRSQEDKTGPVDIQKVMESTLRMAWNEIRHRARLEKTYGKTPPVEACESRLGQVFLNIVINAAQVIPEGRAEDNAIRISTYTDQGGRVVIEVADTGPGMPPEVLRQLFTPFFTTKPIGVGTGLGLSICHGIVTGFGGSIDVTSEMGKGTTFRISLPQARVGTAVETPHVAPGMTMTARRRGRILVIDDEPAIAKALQRTLSAEHEVVAVCLAEEALARIGAGERFDVILCDLMMPQMTGMALHAELSRIAPEQADRMVFLTGGAFTPRARAFLDETPNQVVEKPFEARLLRALINERILGG